MSQFPDHATLSNLQLIEALYAKYQADPLNVEPSWRYFFEGMDFVKSVAEKVPSTPSAREEELKIHALVDAFRRYGHLEVKINPIQLEAPPPADELEIEQLGFGEGDLGRLYPSGGFAQDRSAPLREVVAALQRIYCSRIGFEYMHIEDLEIRKWVQERIEPKLEIDLSADEKTLLLEMLNRSEVFETFIHTKYVGQKRFSIEGGETLIPCLMEIIERGSQLGTEVFVIGMAHRGRLNVLSNILQKPYSVIFQEFEDSILPQLLPEGNGDVKYHKGFSSDVATRGGKTVHLHLAANSSCLESVDPVVLGLAKSTIANDDKTCASILVHGDAALSGQGVIYEILEFMNLPGYSTNGTVHIAMNNQIGFTTLPNEGRSTRYCTDIALAFGCPVFHVNAEDPESCLFAAKLAIEFRMKFKRDVFIDLNGYRKYGHNEGDEPAFTQPVQYRIIRGKTSIRELYLEQLYAAGAIDRKIAEEFDAKFKETLEKALERGKKTEAHPPEERYGPHWKAQPPRKTLYETMDTGVKEELLRDAAHRFSEVPEGFHPHPKLEKWIQGRLKMLDEKIDWALGESLAFGTLLLQNISIRLAGQDSQRGTFSQRHAVWVDQETEERYCPFTRLGRFDVYNSPLSEYAALGFEYGYSWGGSGGGPEGLVLWEAQFGDFSIGAQIVIDHYLTTAEKKWARYSSLVLLLPHGYEGQGPEHSSGRIERFLQLCADDNIQVVNATTPAQYFHLLRRQALRPIKKPLVVFTPKGFLRLPACSSALKEFTTGSFQEVLDDPVPPKKVKRVLLCSGKIFYDLTLERENRKRDDIAILRIEQLYPFHREKVAQLLAKCGDCKDLWWVQEEPKNMGPWEFIHPLIEEVAGCKMRYAGRVPNAVTATGSHAQHKKEQAVYMNEAFG